MVCVEGAVNAAIVLAWLGYTQAGAALLECRLAGNSEEIRDHGHRLSQS